jgi:hypothetical protein
VVCFRTVKPVNLTLVTLEWIHNRGLR